MLPPSEVLAEIIKHLPIDKTLVVVGLASKSLLAPHIFEDVFNAHLHLNRQLHFTKLATICNDNQSLTMFANWLPFNYRALLFGKLLAENYNDTHMIDAKVMPILILLMFNPMFFDPSCCANWPLQVSAQNGLTETVKLLLSDSRVDPSTDDNYAIHGASFHGHHDVVKLLLADQRVDPSARDNLAIRRAAENGHHDIVKLLLSDPRVDSSGADNDPICLATQNGRLETVQLLLSDPRVDPSAKGNRAIRRAARNGHHGIVKLLFSDPRVDPSAQDNCAIRWATENGHHEIVRVLLSDPRVDPSANCNFAIHWATRNGHPEIVQLLLSDPRVANIAMREACEHGDLDFVQELIAVSRGDPTESENSPLRMAFRHKHLEIVKLLLRTGKFDSATALVIAQQEAYGGPTGKAFEQAINEHYS
jgi:ankyrin repeat protein